MAVFEDKPDFESDREEFDSSRPYPRILQHLDLTLNVCVLHISIPPATIEDLQSESSHYVLQDKIVFAAACADNLIRLITLPIVPPSPSSKGRSDLRKSSLNGIAGNAVWGETITELTGHTLMVDTVSITFTASRLDAEERTIATKTPPRSSSRVDEDWSIIVASHSRAVSGLLLVHRLPIRRARKGPMFPHTATTPLQTQYLPSPAVSLTFNSSIFSSRSTQLLIGDKKGACSIYDCELVSSDADTGTSFASQGGAWLLTMLPGFQSSKGPESSGYVNAGSLGNFGRKSMVDAKWVLGGKAVMALLADGEWGIWDIEGAQPGTQKGLLGRSSMKGGAITKFSISGWVEGAPVKSATRSNLTQQSTGKFAPMTPGARKSIEPILFSGRTGHGTAHGAISVARLPAASTSSAADECIAIWLEESFIMIPNLAAYWEAQRNKSGGGGNLFRDGKPGSRLVRIENVNLHGESCIGIDQSLILGPKSRASFPTELLVVGERRVVVIYDSKFEQEVGKQSVAEFSESQAVVRRTGMLEVDDIDAELERMDQTPVRGRRSVAFLA